MWFPYYIIIIWHNGKLAFFPVESAVRYKYPLHEVYPEKKKEDKKRQHLIDIEELQFHVSLSNMLKHGLENKHAASLQVYKHLVGSRCHCMGVCTHSDKTPQTDRLTLTLARGSIFSSFACFLPVNHMKVRYLVERRRMCRRSDSNRKCSRLL
jgi:hypothetical protein